MTSPTDTELDATDEAIAIASGKWKLNGDWICLATNSWHSRPPRYTRDWNELMPLVVEALDADFEAWLYSKGEGRKVKVGSIEGSIGETYHEFEYDADTHRIALALAVLAYLEEKGK